MLNLTIFGMMTIGNTQYLLYYISTIYVYTLS